MFRRTKEWTGFFIEVYTKIVKLWPQQNYFLLCKRHCSSSWHFLVRTMCQLVRQKIKVKYTNSFMTRFVFILGNDVKVCVYTVYTAKLKMICYETICGLRNFKDVSIKNFKIFFSNFLEVGYTNLEMQFQIHILAWLSCLNHFISASSRLTSSKTSIFVEF